MQEIASRVRFQKSRSLAILLIAFCTATFPCRGIAEENSAAQGPRIVFFGDSITAAGGYIKVIKVELSKQKTDEPPVIINRGRSSETVSGLSVTFSKTSTTTCIKAGS